jgi:hypothetical protein
MLPINLLSCNAKKVISTSFHVPPSSLAAGIYTAHAQFALYQLSDQTYKMLGEV